MVRISNRLRRKNSTVFGIFTLFQLLHSGIISHVTIRNLFKVQPICLVLLNTDFWPGCWSVLKVRLVSHITAKQADLLPPSDAHASQTVNREMLSSTCITRDIIIYLSQIKSVISRRLHDSIAVPLKTDPDCSLKLAATNRHNFEHL